MGRLKIDHGGGETSHLYLIDVKFRIVVANAFASIGLAEARQYYSAISLIYEMTWFELNYNISVDYFVFQ